MLNWRALKALAGVMGIECAEREKKNWHFGFFGA